MKKFGQKKTRVPYRQRSHPKDCHTCYPDDPGKGTARMREKDLVREELDIYHNNGELKGQREDEDDKYCTDYCCTTDMTFKEFQEFLEKHKLGLDE